MARFVSDVSMSERPRLILFDVDGTIFDSATIIVDAFEAAFKNCEIEPPSREKMQRTIGLSLLDAIEMMDHRLSVEDMQAIVTAFVHHVTSHENRFPPFFEGMPNLIETLAQVPEFVLGIATGKDKKGLEPLLAHYNIAHHFFCLQTAGEHPSKPSPEMILDALSRTGIEAKDAVMIGDTSFDIDMAYAADVKAIGVSWGYHGNTLSQCTPNMANTADEIIVLLTELGFYD